MFTATQHDEMLDIAIAAIRGSIAAGLPEYLREPGCSFVTLRRRGELLGCIGALQPYQSLGLDIAEHARAAAFEDPRFPPVQDLHDVHVEISVLGPLTDFPAESYDDVVSRLPRGGAVVAADGRRGTFLPAVWEQLPTSEQFVAGLWRKAGLRPRHWPVQIWTYEVEEFGRTVS